MYLSSMLKAQGYESFFFDLRLDSNLYDFLNKLRPEIIAYSIVTGTHKFYANLNRNLKEHFSFFSIFGGPHTTFFPEFIENEGVDAICIGEGEGAIIELVERLKNKQPISEIKNLWIKQDGKIYKNDPRLLVNDLDSIPFPDRELIYKYKGYRNRSNKYLLTSRGCPYDCTYCFNHSLKKIYQGKGRFCRRRSTFHVIDEIEDLQKKAPIKRIQFFDDVFILDKKWILEFCQLYRERINLPFICYVRVNLLDEEIVQALKEAGVITITFAIETEDNYLRNKVLKRGISNEEISKAVELMHKYKISFFIQNMVALPGETLENALNTLKLNAKCNPSYANASIFQPYPGIELTEYAVAHGFYNKKNDILYDSFYEKSILNIENKNELENLSRLFSLGVEFPILIPFIKLLIRLPGNILFKWIWHITRTYGYIFRISWINLSDVLLPFYGKIGLIIKNFKKGISFVEK